MQKLILSQRLDELAKSLAEDLKKGRSSPLETLTILVPDPFLKPWLLQEIASIDQVIANCKVFTVEEWFSKKFHNVLNSKQLFLSIYQELLKMEDLSLKEYLSLASSTEKSYTACLVELAETLSALFVKYSVFYKSFPFQQEENWQVKLFHQIFSQGPYKLFEKELERTFPLEKSLFCFGIDFLPQSSWRYLLRIPHLHIYLFSPCTHFWEDVFSDWERKSMRKKGVSPRSLDQLELYLDETPPLLANLGKLGRENLKIFADLDLETEEKYKEASKDTLLQKIQNQVLHFETNRDFLLDESITLYLTGSSRYKEIDHLCQKILSLTKQGIAFSEMGVFTQSISVYAPLIELLFARYQIPYRIFGVEVSSQSTFLQGLFLLFSVLTLDWNEEALLTLFGSPSFYLKATLEPRELSSIKKWIEVAEKEGIDSLIEKLAVFYPDDPFRIEGGQLETFKKFMGSFTELKKEKLYRKKQESQKSLKDWALYLEKISADFLQVDGELEIDQEAKRHFFFLLEELRSFDLLFQTRVFSAEAIFRLLRKPIYTQIQASSLHAVKIAPFSAGSLTPCKALFLIGMDEEEFSPKNKKSSLNLLKKPSQFIPEDWDESRYLFLKALFAAEKHFILSYGHISKEEGKPIGPSLLILELFEAIDQSAKTPISPFLSKEIPQEDFVERKKEPLSLEAKKEELTVSIKDLASLAKNPLKFYLKKRMGIFIEDQKEESFALLKSIWVRSSFETCFERVLKEKKGDLFEGAFGEAFIQQVQLEVSSYKKALSDWEIESLHSLEFMQTCREKQNLEKSPPLEVLIQGDKKVKIIGKLDHLSSKGLVYFGKDQIENLLRIWPEWLIASIYTGKSEIFCLKTKKIRSVKNPKEALSKYLTYYFKALEDPSPFLPEFASPLLKRNLEALEKKRESLFSDRSKIFKSASIDWIKEKKGFFSASEIEETWGEILRETFEELSCIFSKKKEVYEKV